MCRDVRDGRGKVFEAGQFDDGFTHPGAGGGEGLVLVLRRSAPFGFGSSGCPDVDRDFGSVLDGLSVLEFPTRHC